VIVLIRPQACLVLDVLGDDKKQKLVSWFVDLQIRDYKSTFQKSKEAAWLDKIDRRFVWLKRRLVTYFVRLFTPHCFDVVRNSCDRATETLMAGSAAFLAGCKGEC
jgi:hypothetical protein